MTTKIFLGNECSFCGEKFSFVAAISLSWEHNFMRTFQFFLICDSYLVVKDFCFVLFGSLGFKKDTNVCPMAAIVDFNMYM